MKKTRNKTHQKDAQLAKLEPVFSPLQQMFIALFNGSVKETALACGTSDSYGRTMFAIPDVKQAIKIRHNKEYNPKILTRQERQAFWSRIIVDSDAEMRDRLKASELLGKSEMDFMDTPVRKDEGTMVLLDTALKSEAFKIAAIRLDAIIVKGGDLSGIIPGDSVDGEVVKKPGEDS